ncbi:MAG: ABC transporter permease, partial [Gemmatimonadota bacterium]
MRGALVVAQVAISVILVVGAALMTQSFVRQMRVDLGFKPDHVVAVRFTISGSQAGPDGQLANHIRALLSQVRATPGVTAAGATKALPFRGNGEPATLTIQGAANTEGGLSSVMVMHVTDGYFGAMGIPVLAGREFGSGDAGGRALVILANQAFLKRYFPAETPVTAIGKRLVTARVEVEIIGVVGDVRQTSVTEPAEPTLYIS